MHRGVSVVSAIWLMDDTDLEIVVETRGLDLADVADSECMARPDGTYSRYRTCGCRKLIWLSTIEVLEPVDR